jgi:hypothetical protein
VSSSASVVSQCTPVLPSVPKYPQKCSVLPSVPKYPQQCSVLPSAPSSVSPVCQRSYHSRVLCGDYQLLTPGLRTMPNNGEPTAPVQTEAPALRNPEVDRVTVRVPPFWSNEPALWFSRLESQLALANVTADITKFHYVVSNLDFRNPQVVHDILQTPPRTDKYEALKTALISRLSSSEEQRIQQLLQLEDLGDRKPSEFLRHLRSLATVPENLLRSLWTNRLPHQTQVILTTQTDSTLDKLAELADKVHEMLPTAPHIDATQIATTTDLSKELVQLRKEVAELSKACNRQQRRNQSPAPQDKPENTICWYHNRFKGKATKSLFLPSGKLSTGPFTAAIGPVLQQRRLFVVDVATKERFLVDTGASRTLSKPERNYSVGEKECLAVIFAIEKFRPYVEGIKCKVITNHSCLQFLQKMSNPTGRLARWPLKLQQYDYDIEYRQGAYQKVPDALSRAFPGESETVDKRESIDICVINIDPDNVDRAYREFRPKIESRPDDYPQFRVRENVIYKYASAPIPLETNVREWKIYVPVNRRKEVLRASHDPPTASHFGYFKTLARVTANYYWPNIRKDVAKYVKACEMCGEQKPDLCGKIGLMGREKNVRFPWQIVAIDMMGPFPRSKNGNKYLLVVGDWFTKYTMLLPMKKASAVAITRFFEDQVFLTFGTPQFVMCDDGTCRQGPNTTRK